MDEIENSYLVEMKKKKKEKKLGYFELIDLNFIVRVFFKFLCWMI